MRLSLDIQQASSHKVYPAKSTCKRWIKTALNHVHHQHNTELTLRFVDPQEIREINHTFRHADKETNVLSFPFDGPQEPVLPYIGDIIICLQVVEKEAQAQNKRFYPHLAHMIIHGVLHLLGYDHMTDADAEVMESLEIEILKELKISNPYDIREKTAS